MRPASRDKLHRNLPLVKRHSVQFSLNQYKPHVYYGSVHYNFDVHGSRVARTHRVQMVQWLSGDEVVLAPEGSLSPSKLQRIRFSMHGHDLPEPAAKEMLAAT